MSSSSRRQAIAWHFSGTGYPWTVACTRGMSNVSTLPTSVTDWACIDAMCDEETDGSDGPEITPEMVVKAWGRKGFAPATEPSPHLP